MKKLTAILLGTLIASSAALAQTNQVLSRNAVGYVKVNLQSNKLYLVTNPFVNLDGVGDPKLTNVFSVLPGGTTVSIWNEADNQYDNYSRSSRGAWLDKAVTAQVRRADGIFIRYPKTNAVDLFLMGEVPDRFTFPSNFVARVPGISMVGLPYPVSIRLTNTVMAQQVPGGTTISIWNPETTQYVNYSKSARGAWLADAVTAMIQPGQGMVIRSTNAANSWYENKPYTWP